MRIRITRQMPEGARIGGVPWPDEGEEIDLPSAQAAHLVAAGVAEEATEEAPQRRRRKAKEDDDG